MCTLMSRAAWIACIATLAVAVFVTARRTYKARIRGTFVLAVKRVQSPTVILFSAYLLVAALVVPVSDGETGSPLLWLAPAFPIVYAMASFSAAANPKAPLPERLALALLFAGTLASAAAITLACVSPAFVPVWLR
ncbi:MAG: hypothetical protein IPK82_13540 [Polyangiaceae bacterium]|nr:hypothetical protein [Polyangiaceae bacterium]